MKTLSEHYLNKCLATIISVPANHNFLIDKKTDMCFVGAIKQLESRGEFAKHNFKMEFSKGEFIATKIINSKLREKKI